jgi:stalled ribosome rescue protein Dom34
MESVRRVVVWIDHQSAKIFHVEPGDFTVATVQAPQRQLSRKAEEQGRHAGSGLYFDQVVTALRGEDQVLVVGPSSAKLDFVRHVHQHDHTLTPKIVGVETLDHPTDPQLAAYVRHYFHQEPERVAAR